MPQSIIDAIKQGMWDFEPKEVQRESLDATQALPGTEAKLEVLAARVQQGLPLWHPRDRRSFEDTEN